MVLSRLRSPDAELTVRVSPASATPGDRVEARISLHARQDFALRSGGVELVRTETYIQRVQHQHGQSYHRRRQHVSYATEQFLGREQVRDGSSHSGRFGFEVPADALPMLDGVRSHGINPGIAWGVRVKLDVARARDLSATEPLIVEQSRSLNASQPMAVVEQKRLDQGALTLELDADRARRDGVINGMLRIDLEEPVGVQGIRVELARVEKFGDGGGTHVIDSRLLESETDLQRGQRDWPFRLTLAEVSAPSMAAEKSAIRWQVRGILNRRMRRNLRVEREILVEAS